MLHKPIGSTPISSTLDWTDAYTKDTSTHTIILGLSNHDNNTWSIPELNNIDKYYHQKLWDGKIDLFHGTLIHNKCIFPKTKYIACIIVPISLHQRIFDYYHSGPLGAHMGEYKSLPCIRLHFTWPQLWNNIKSMLQACAHCQAYNSWRSCHLEVNFSWPVTSLFYIMYCELWSPGQLPSSSSKKMYWHNTHHVNYALGKDTVQSSNHKDLAVALKAIDGITEQIWIPTTSNNDNDLNSIAQNK